MLWRFIAWRLINCLDIQALSRLGMAGSDGHGKQPSPGVRCCKQRKKCIVSNFIQT